MTATHAVTMNGQMSTELTPEPGGLSAGERLTASLHRMDGERFFACLLWRLPEGVEFDRYDLASGPDEYIQCAGGGAGRLTCEIRVASDGGFRHYVIGRRGDAGPKPASEPIRWAAFETTVQENEVLSADEVAELFQAYLADETIPAAYQCRELVFSRE